MDEPAFGPWIVTRPLGRGAHATVYRCRHRDDPARMAAVKVLHGADAVPRQVARLAREVRILRRLDHPGIVGVMDADTDAPEPWVALELVDGVPLDRARPGARPPDEVAALARDVAATLLHAHSVGVFHRDVKPGNLLVERVSGRVRLVDFGIGAALGESTLTDPAAPAPGTVDYSPPEWFRSLPGELDPALLDAYGLGVVVFEQLTGERAFRGSLADVIAAKASPLDPVSAPPALRSLVVDLCAADPRSRALLDEVGARLAEVAPVPEPTPEIVRVTAPADAFVGRDDALAELRALPPELRLVTLVGPPGVGKSRLAREWLRGHPWVELGEATDLGGALRAAGRALGCAPTLAAVTGRLRGDGHRAVLLDDADLAVDALREVLTQAFRGTPDVCWVVTSRRRLRIGGERVITVPPLTVPVADEPSSAGDLWSARLRERGRRPRDPAELASRVRATDGLPLAVELLAASVAAPTGAADALADVLTGAWERLDPDERRVLAGCSVFRAPFGLRLAEDVVGAGARPLSEVLQAMVDQSWLGVRRGRGSFTWLRTLRAFAAEHLVGADGDEVRTRHAFAASRPADLPGTPTSDEVEEALAAWDTAEGIGDRDLAVTLALVVAGGSAPGRGAWTERAQSLIALGAGTVEDRRRLGALLAR